MEQPSLAAVPLAAVDVPNWGMLSLGELREEGHFSSTHHATITTAGTSPPASIKLVVKRSLITKDNVTLEDERSVMERLLVQADRHAHLLDICFIHASDPVIFFAYHPWGDASLATVLQERGPLAPATVRDYILQTANALGYLHALYIMHRDVTAETVTTDGSGHVKLTGFDFACPHARASGLRGTPESMAPEMLLQVDLPSGYTAAVDWWSLGCLTVRLLTGQQPFAEAELPRLLRKIIHEPIILPEHPHLGPPEARFIHALLERSPEARLGTQGGHISVLRHAWLVM